MYSFSLSDMKSLCSRLSRCPAQPTSSESLQSSFLGISSCDQSAQPSQTTDAEANGSGSVPLEANGSGSAPPLEANGSGSAPPLEANGSGSVPPLEANDSESVPSFDPGSIGGDDNDLPSQSVELGSSAVQDLSNISSIPGEGESDLSGVYDQASSSIQGSVQISDTTDEHSKESLATGSRKRHTDDSDDSDYVNHRGTLHIVNGARHYGYKTKAVKKAIAKRVDAMNGLNVDSLSGREKVLLNLRNVGAQKRRELRTVAKATKRQKTSNT